MRAAARHRALERPGASHFHPPLQLSDASQRFEFIPWAAGAVRMRGGVFQVLLKLFIGALDQQTRVMSLPKKGREPGQRQARNKLLPSNPDQRLLFIGQKFTERLSRKIRCNCSIEIPLKFDQRQRMPLPEAHGWVGADIEDDVENELRVAVE